MNSVEATPVVDAADSGGAAELRPRRTLRRRLGAWTRSAGRDVAYAAAVCVWAVAGFSVVVAGVTVTASLLVLLVGVPVWVGFVHVLRWTTWVDRRLAGWQRQERVPAAYRRPRTSGFLPLVRTLTTDPQTWKDLAWLGLDSFVGFAYGLVVTTGAGLVVAYVSMPAWFWAVSDPHAEYGVTNLGLFAVDTWREAVGATGIGLALLPLVLLLARWCARRHSRLAVRLLAAR